MWNCIYFDKLPTSISNFSLTHINNTLMICLGNTKTKVFYRCSLLRAGFFYGSLFWCNKWNMANIKMCTKKTKGAWMLTVFSSNFVDIYILNVLTIEMEVARDESYFVCTQSLVTRVRDFHVHTYQPGRYTACFCWRTRIRTVHIFEASPSQTRNEPWSCNQVNRT